MKKKKFLIISDDTLKEYRTKNLKTQYKNIKNGRIYRVYEVKRFLGVISNNTVHKEKRGK